MAHTSKVPRGEPRGNLLHRSSSGDAGRVSGAAKRNSAVATNPASPRLRHGRHAIHPRGKPRGILAKTNKIANEMTVEITESKIKNFYSRLDQAMLKSPPSKQRVKDAIHMRGADRCPVRLRRLGIDLILKYGDDLADLFCRYGEDTCHVQAYEFSIGLQNHDKPDKINPIRVLTTQAEWTDEWGARWGHAAGGVGATTLSNPLSDWSMLDKYLAERMPDPRAKNRFDAVMPILKMHGRDRYFAGMSHLALFERFHCLRGMENTFVNFYANPVETERLLLLTHGKMLPKEL